MKRGLLCLTTAILLFAVVPTAGAGNVEKLHKSEAVVQFFNKRSWMIAPNKQHCRDVPWQRTCRIARKHLAFHKARAASVRKQMWRLIPTTNDWLTSVTLAQRVYPGTKGWLLFISDREGGWGPFVMNRQGSGAGGWLQFMSSTFYAYVGDAKADLHRRGFNVNPSVWVWTHPLGQALTGAYMRYTGRDGCHWCL